MGSHLGIRKVHPSGGKHLSQPRQKPPDKSAGGCLRARRLAHGPASLRGPRGPALFPVTSGSLPPAGSLQPHGATPLGTALNGPPGSSGPQSLRGRPGWPPPEEGPMVPPCEVRPLGLSWRVLLGLSLPRGSGWGKGPLGHWTGPWADPHPLQLAGPAVTRRAMPEPMEPSGSG